MPTDPPLLVNTNRVEITGLTKDNGTYTVDLTSFLNHESPKFVIVEAYHTGTSGNLGVSVHPVGGADLVVQLAGTGFSKNAMTWVVPLNENNEVNYRIQGSAINLYIHAEIGGNGVFQTPIATQAVTPANQWNDYDMTSILADASHSGNVEGIICTGRNGTGGIAGVRRNTSTDAFSGAETGQRGYALVAKVDDNNIVETFITTAGKSGSQNSNLYIWGYWLRGYGLEATADKSPAEGYTTLNAWADISANKLDKTETAALTLARAEQIVSTIGVRSDGSTNPTVFGNNRNIHSFHSQ